VYTQEDQRLTDKNIHIYWEHVCNVKLSPVYLLTPIYRDKSQYYPSTSTSPKWSLERPRRTWQDYINLVVRMLDGTRSGSCRMTGFCINSVEISGSVFTELVTYILYRNVSEKHYGPENRQCPAYIGVKTRRLKNCIYSFLCIFSSGRKCIISFT
jgi:hypothetical protein